MFPDPELEVELAGRRFRLEEATPVAHDWEEPTGPGGRYVYLYRAPGGGFFALYLGPGGPETEALSPEAAWALYWTLAVRRLPPGLTGLSEAGWVK